MPIRIHSSNRIENLQQRLCSELTSHPLSNPLVAEIIIVPTYAMSRWLNLRIAQQRGVAANIEYPLPAAWLWAIAKQAIEDIPASDPLSAESMTWKIFALLPGLTLKAEFKELHRYLDSDDSGIKRWQLSVRIAEVFERYQQYRPEMIRQWSSAKISDWQAILWQSLVAELEGEHRVDVISRLVARLNAPDPMVNLPERISLFAVSQLPPLTLDVLFALSAKVDICFYMHSPSDQYFADLKPEKALAKLRLSQPLEINYYETGNELLASWGSLAKSMQTLFLQQDYPVAEETDSYEKPGRDTLLQSIQQNIFDLGTTPVNTSADDSLCIHVCHSAMRECQVLYDQLLNILQENPRLDAEDILVMIPEISRYAPYIEAVFGYEDNPDKPYLPWNLSDISIIDEHPLIQSFLQLLHLPDSRFEVSAITSLLEIPQIAKRFNLHEIAVNNVLEWIDAANVRWGIDASFKQEINQPATLQNTWLQARQRLFAGYALGNIRLWNDIAPLGDIDVNTASRIGDFLNLFESLDNWRKQLQKPATAREWVKTLNRLLADFYQSPETGDDYLQEIRDAIDELNLAGDSMMTSALLRHWMQSQLGRQQRQGRLFSGGITFCGMRPLRNLPFEVICLLGMNDNAFPRRAVSHDFDYLNSAPRLGDPSTTSEDRYLMLETLLCARHTLYISYTGRSLKDNSECQPSVLISELIDLIDGQTDPEGLSKKLIQLHPMQAFSVDNFIEPLFGFDTDWCEVAKAVQRGEQISVASEWPQPIEATALHELSEIDLNTLKRFIDHPVRYFFNSLFRIYFERHEDIDNDEKLSLDALDTWQIKNNLARDVLEGHSDSFAVLDARGVLPHGTAGSAAFQSIHQNQQSRLHQLEMFSALTVETFSIKIHLRDEYLLAGQIGNYYRDKGLMHHSASNLNGQNLLRLWIDHLCLCAGNQQSENDSSYLVTSDRTLSFASLEPQQAVGILFEYCELFKKGRTEILPIFPKSSYAYALEADTDKAMSKALAAWYYNPHSPVKADEEDEYIQLALRNSAQIPLEHPEFKKYAALLYEQALSHMTTL